MIHEHIWLTTQPMEEPDRPEHFLELLEQGNLYDRLMFATDYPHWDFDAPSDALPKIKLPDGFEQKLMFENALGFYRLPEVTPDMARYVVGTVDDIPPGERKIVEMGARRRACSTSAASTSPYSTAARTRAARCATVGRPGS